MRENEIVLLKITPWDFFEAKKKTHVFYTGLTFGVIKQAFV